MGHVPAHAGQYDLQRIVKALEDLFKVLLIKLLRKSSMSQIVVYAYRDRTS